MTDCGNRRKRNESQQLKSQRQRCRNKLLELVMAIKKDWLVPAEKKKLDERLKTLQDQKTELEFRSSVLNQLINNIFLELGSLKDSLEDPECAELTTLLEAFNLLISHPMEPQTKE